MSHFQNNLIKLITVILIRLFTHFYCILYCFYILVHGPAATYATVPL